MRRLQLIRSLIFVLLLACNETQEIPTSNPGAEALAQVSLAAQALVVSDRDGDGVADAVDNCPSIANADQADRNDVGPGDACELALSWSRGLLTSYARFQSHKELVLWFSPLLLTGAPDLLRVSAPTPGQAVAHLSPLSLRLGVRSANELWLDQIDMISGNEVLRLALGTSSLLGQAKASQVWLHVEGSASVSVTFFRGAQQLDTKTAPVQGVAWLSFTPNGSELFDRIELRAASGKFALRGQSDGALFALTNALLPCPSGYARVGASCVDIDECAGLSRVCDALTSCQNLPGTFTCGACPEGYRGSGSTSCVDVDECAENPASCSPLSTCSNTGGSYQCGACPAGYQGDGHTCTDVDECAVGGHACDPLVLCSNREGGYDCGPCPSGFAGGGQTGCTDIDECAGADRSCDGLTTCANTVGGFECGACPMGYRGTGATSCVDVDECAEGLAQCSPLVACANTAGGYQCGACPAGYRGDGFVCNDVDECAEQTAQCSALAGCENTMGGYQCGACPHGYTGDGITCADVDECQDSPCDPRTSCSNTQGNYLCTDCPTGYTGSGYAGCVDVDECAAGTDLCSPLVTCANTSGGYACAPCPSGYRGDGFSCADIDECAEQSDDCDDRAGCSNHPGGYQCGSCPLGFSGDGHSCVDIDECAAAPCDPLSACTNSVGSYSCGACPSGYAGDGYAGCVDIDECANNDGGCPATEGCQNLPGSMRCVACAAGSVGVVTSCGVGVCAASGVTRCERGAVVDSCAPGAPSASDNTCDGRDDDCDGSSDEDYLPQTSSCGRGACAATGLVACVSAQLHDSCTPTAPASASDDVCDGIDADCDGSVDEEFSGTCTASSAQVCLAGQIVQAANCSDTLICNGTEVCSAGRCGHVGPALDDSNPCTTDACSESTGITHVDRPLGVSCSDGNVCNGNELCLPCRESENLISNPSFERVWAPNIATEGALPMDWWAVNTTPDTYSFDDSWGRTHGAFGNFTNMTSVADGVRWVAGASNIPERFAQELGAPLVSGQRYRVSGKVHQAATNPRPGGYDVSLSKDYTLQPAASPILLGYLGTTSNHTGWADVSFEFVAPNDIAEQRLLVFTPRSPVANMTAYMGLDLVKLVGSCASSGSRSCQRQDAPALDDGQACTADSCNSSTGVTHAPLATGSLCNGNGVCSASGVCSNRAPILTNAPRPYYVLSAGNYTHQATASDPDGDAVTFALGADRRCAWTATAQGLFTLFSNSAGSACVLSVEARDTHGALSTQVRLVQVVTNDPSPPMMASQPARQAIYLGESFSYRPRVWSRDPTAAITVALTTAPAGMTVDSSGLITWTPSAAQLGSHEITSAITTPFGVVQHVFLLTVLAP
jgi:hypothetical protein